MQRFGNELLIARVMNPGTAGGGGGGSPRPSPQQNAAGAVLGGYSSYAPPTPSIGNQTYYSYTPQQNAAGALLGGYGSYDVAGYDDYYSDPAFGAGIDGDYYSY